MDFSLLLLLFFKSIKALVGLEVLILLCWKIIPVMFSMRLNTTPITNRRRLIVPSHLSNTDLYRWAAEEIPGMLPSEHPESLKAKSVLAAVVGSMQRVVLAHHPHLDGINWDAVLVKPGSEEDFTCFPQAGRIVIVSGFSEDISNDATLALNIGHEVAHSILRDVEEQQARNTLVQFMQSLFFLCLICFWSDLENLFQLVASILCTLVVHSIGTLLLRLAEQRNEMEADYIGMLLAASAGYDPREFAMHYLKDDLPHLIQLFYSMHPTDRRRTQALLSDKVMKEAQDIYDRSKALMRA